MSVTGSASTQVLVVGAGPVGLMAALRLHQQGVAVRIIDRERSHHGKSFPILIHPQTLRLFSALGITSSLFWRGRSVPRLALFVERALHAHLTLPAASSLTAAAMTLPQDLLSQALVNALALRGVCVEWGTELTALEQDDRGVGVLLRRAPGSSLCSGRSQADFVSVTSQFLIGADGYQSSVRQLLGLEFVPRGRLQAFAFFDAVASELSSEAQLAWEPGGLSSLYALRGGRGRFSFQLDGDLNDKPGLARLRRLAAERMPWYHGQIEACEWSDIAEFRPALCEHFGRGRVWLAGDAVHACGPLGVQSLNVGMDEASELALLIAAALRTNEEPSFGPGYDARRTGEWRRLLGLETFVSERAPRPLDGCLSSLFQALPASGRDLEDLLDQLCAAAPRGAPRV